MYGLSNEVLGDPLWFLQKLMNSFMKLRKTVSFPSSLEAYGESEKTEFTLAEGDGDDDNSLQNCG